MSEKISQLLAYIIVILFGCNFCYYLFPFPPMIWRGLIITCYIFVILNSIKFGFSYTEKAIMLFVLVVTIYFLLGYEDYKYSMTNIGNTYVGLLSFPAMTALSRRGAFTQQFFLISVLFLTFICIPYYQHEKISIFETVLFEQGWMPEEGTINASVVFVMLLPSLMLIEYPILSYAIAGVCIFFLMDSTKRGNIVAAVLPLLLLLYRTFQNNKKSVIGLSIFLICMGFAGNWIYNLILDNDRLLERYQETLEGNSSHRDIIYVAMWKLWSQSESIIKQLFGYGYDGTVLFGGYEKYAHNDWLEILVDFGLFGLVIYINIFIGLFKNIKKCNDLTYKLALIALLYVWLIKATVSMGFTGQTTSLLSLPFAYVIGNTYRTRKLSESRIENTIVS